MNHYDKTYSPFRVHFEVMSKIADYRKAQDEFDAARVRLESDIEARVIARIRELAKQGAELDEWEVVLPFDLMLDDRDSNEKRNVHFLSNPKDGMCGSGIIHGLWEDEEEEEFHTFVVSSENMIYLYDRLCLLGFWDDTKKDLFIEK